MIPLRTLVAIALVTLGIAIVLISGLLPLGIPGEWTWTRIELSRENAIELLGNLALASPIFLLWLGAFWWLAKRIDSYSESKGLIFVRAFTLLSFFLVGAIQSLPPSPWPEMKGLVLYYPHSSGYFHRARYEMGDTKSFLAGYEDLMAQGDVGHLGTHPPGLFLFHRAIGNACASFPTLRKFALATVSDNVSIAFEEIDRNLQTEGRSLTETDRASLWLAMLLTRLLAVSTAIPLFLILRRYFSPRASFISAALFLIIPAMAIFLPKSDAIYPFLGVSFLWLWISARESQFYLRSVLAGVVFWVGSTLSLAMVPWGLIAGVYSLIAFVSEKRNPPELAEMHKKSPPSRLLLTPAIAVGAFFLLTSLSHMLAEINLFNVWLWNYHNHAQFYSPENYPRSWWKWVLVNPLETALAVGVPLFLLAVMGTARAFRHSEQEPIPRTYRTLLTSCLLVWGFIWLSGKNSGEAARLWLVFFPILCLSAAPVIEKKFKSKQETLWILALQLIACATTVISVSGFHP